MKSNLIFQTFEAIGYFSFCCINPSVIATRIKTSYCILVIINILIVGLHSFYLFFIFNTSLYTSEMSRKTRHCSKYLNISSVSLFLLKLNYQFKMKPFKTTPPLYVNFLLKQCCKHLFIYITLVLYPYLFSLSRFHRNVLLEHRQERCNYLYFPT